MSTHFNLPPGLKKLTPAEPSRYALQGADVRPEPDQPGSALISMTDGRALAVLETEAGELGGRVFVPAEALPTGKAEALAERDGDGDRFLVTVRGKSPTVAVCPVDQNFPPIADVIPDPSQYRPVCRIDVDLLAKLAQALDPSDKHLTILCRIDPEDSVKRPLVVLGESGTLGVLMPIQIDATSDACRSTVKAMAERVRRAFLDPEALAAENVKRAARAIELNPLGPEAARALMAVQIGAAVIEAGRVESLADPVAEALAEAGESEAIRAEAPEGETLAA